MSGWTMDLPPSWATAETRHVSMDRDDYDALIAEVERLTEANKRLKSQIRQQPSNSKKLTKGEAKQIRDMYRKGYKVTELAVIFDVNHSTVSRIVKHVYWKGI
ncbi:helix-turn-helix domain-containing protein [Mycobacteroides abscessus]|uniref:helix-turn-helix domain-containing protein n=2 Tax=Mycobacteroides abscessus TaxID=36809 RepID=UPI00092C7898|nr:helix-turn-helix domain-containing protein [Mycobacteroides abscessus]SIC88370.1 Uncharacterised protein [Mycobacteroides abscessus subsp. bolletii]SKT76154.1 Uncharacterised protein [Mycobacteroides abscessus subsp. bolletii]SLD34793.1 Uncharacterised protein [Mycobacteroides abscessus subsp. bolletii]SLF80002.1 Uncharacterised protein [Mycobacteroides abscessus subsp. bolletii]